MKIDFINYEIFSSQESLSYLKKRHHISTIFALYSVHPLLTASKYAPTDISKTLISTLALKNEIRFNTY